jgi:hypothetical protein
MARLRDLSRTPQRTYSDPGRAADWLNAMMVAGVLSAVVVGASIAITLYDTSAFVAARQHTTASEPSRTTGHGGGLLETDGSAR